MASRSKLEVNGLTHGVPASPDTPLLDVPRSELHLHGPRFECGPAQRGACPLPLDCEEIPAISKAGTR